MHATGGALEHALTEQSIADDQERIRRVNEEIQAFLEPYQVGRKIKIPFSGSTWNTAVKSLEIYLDRNHVCEHCYGITGNYRDMCRECKKGKMSNRPAKIFEIVARHAPKARTRRTGAPVTDSDVSNQQLSSNGAAVQQMSAER